MGETANTAFYAVVFARGSVPKARLDEALTRALSTNSPLEQVLVQMRALSPADCEQLVRLREQLARVCHACEGVTYLLQGETEATRPCEYCGGRLLTREQQRARDAARAAPPPAAASRSGVQRAMGQSGTQHRTSGVSPAMQQTRAAPAPAAPSAEVRALEARLGQLDGQLGNLARELLDERQARAQLGQFLNELVAKLDAMPQSVDSIAEQAAQRLVQAEVSRLGDPGERALQAVQERLGVDDVARLPARIAEQVAPRILQAVRDRLGLEELQELPARMKALEKNGAAPRVDEAALEARLSEKLARAAGASGGGLRERDIESIASRAAEQALEALEPRLEMLRSQLGRGGGGGAPAAPAIDQDALVSRVTAAAVDAAQTAAAQALAAMETALTERVLEAVTSRVPAQDPEALAESITRRALQAVGERLDRQGDPQELAEQAAARAVAAAQQQGGGAQAALQSLDERVEALTVELSSRPPAPSAAELARQVSGQLDLAGIEQRVASASAEVLEALDARVDDLLGQVGKLQQQLSQLDDPRELLQRSLSQATAKMAETLDARLMALRRDLQSTPAAAPAAAPDLSAVRKELGDTARAEVDKAARGVLKEVETRIAAEAAARKQVVDEIRDALETFEARLAARSERSKEAGGGVAGSAKVAEEAAAQVRESLTAEGDPVAEALIERVRQGLQAAGVGGGGGMGGGGGGDAAPATEQLIDKAAARALEWVEDRLSNLEKGGGVEMEMARATARAAAEEVVNRRVKELQAQAPPPSDPGASSADLGKSNVLDPKSSGVNIGVLDPKKFVALAREVKSIKDALEGLQQGGGGGGGDPAEVQRLDKELAQLRSTVDHMQRQQAVAAALAERAAATPGPGRPGAASGGAPDLVAIFSSAEFKQTFDAKVKEVLNYIKSDLVPSAVKKAMQQAS